ncbi:MAG: hypothetical protein HUJ26_20605 [Planctomycetaceae bacterium]|nr:hypothetical protein [Planctomycetaceae bacterium]
MNIPLSEKTSQAAAVLFSEPVRTRIMTRLLQEVSDNIPWHENSNPERLERIRFSILKLIAEDAAKEDNAFRLAKKDWRDLLMEAGFGHATVEHEKWFQNLTNQE